jgi:seryl-tRNA synthetase
VLHAYVVTASTMQGTSQLPKFEEDLFAAKIRAAYMDGADLYLIPDRRSVPLTNHRGRR